MADTGAPWNIPYVEPSDLVRDYPAADEAMAEAVAAGLTAAGNAGIGSNVVQAVKTDTFFTSSSSFVDVPGLAVAITPSADTSKILVVVSGLIGHNGANERINMRLFRNSTAIALSTGGASGDTAVILQPGEYSEVYSVAFVDSPATAASVTYKIAVSTPSGTVEVGRLGGSDRRGINSITAIEVAA